jgi:3-ketosteroid 9alpha-monooxygenase subunit A
MALVRPCRALSRSEYVPSCRSDDDVNSGVKAINGGLGVAVTMSWGMVDHRTITAVTPVDDDTSDVRFSVYIGQHQRYSDPPALSSSEYEGFTAIRNWAMQFYPDGRGGSAAELRAQSATQALRG